MSTKISQREARRLRKRVEQLEKVERDRANAWTREWVGGVHVGTATVHAETAASLRTARKLGHALVVTTDDSAQITFHAIRLQATR